ncbi:MAG: hypothetical protein ACR2KV_16355 [Solirubrobacteraceae bacterium]
MPPPQRSSLRAGALLGAGALLLHELRYLVAWGGGAGPALGDQGHAYLGYVTPLAVGFVAVAAAELVLRLGHRRELTPGRCRWTRAWLGASAGLLAIYVGQGRSRG